MNGINSIGFIICVLVVLMCFLKLALPSNKAATVMKLMISVFILSSIISGIKNTDLDSIKKAIDQSNHSKDVWEQSAERIGEGLKSEFQNYLNEQELKATIVSVEVTTDQNSFVVNKVILKGRDAGTAKNLLVGRYRLGINCFEVKNE